jgi:hypothetical protein
VRCGFTSIQIDIIGLLFFSFEKILGATNFESSPFVIYHNSLSFANKIKNEFKVSNNLLTNGFL